MGEGTDSCCGYDSEYDEYSDGLIDGVWTQFDGTKIKVTKMTVRHLKAALLVVKRMSRMSNFSSDSEKWDDWVCIFQDEIAYRMISESKIEKPKVYNGEKLRIIRGAKVKMQCHCGNVYFARKADIDRGWGFSCSKRCAAIRREFGRPKAKLI